MVTSADTILLVNPSVTSDKKVELIVQQTGTLQKTMTVTNPNLKQTEKTESSIQNLTMTTDGIESQRESEELEFDDSSVVDYDLDYTVQY